MNVQVAFGRKIYIMGYFFYLERGRKGGLV